MKKNYTPIKLLGFFILFILSLEPVQSQSFTEYQIIHNSPDPLLDSVDAWEGYAGPYILQEDFEFRTALPAVSIPSGPALMQHISIADPYPPMSSNIIKTSTGYQRIADESYIIYYVGVYDTGFSHPEPLDIVFYERPVESISTDSVSIVFVNGSTDLGKIDIDVTGIGKVIDNAPFAPKPVNAYPYKLESFKLKTGVHTFNITDTTGTNQIRSYTGDLSALGGQSLALFTSGFLYPDSNRSGAALGLFAALKSGEVIEFTSQITGLSKSENNNNLSVFPIPGKDEITIRSSGNFNKNLHVEITDISGKIVSLKPFQINTENEIKIQLSDFHEGTYMIKITDNAITSTAKFSVIK